MYRLFQIILILIISCFTLFSTPPLVEKIKSQFSNYNKLYRHEKIYINYDKPYYSAGETVFFKIFLVDGFTLKNETISTLVHVELISPDMKIINERVINTEIGGVGDFVLSDSLKTGTYLVRAYTNFQQNYGNEFFFLKSFEVFGQDKINVLDNTKELDSLVQKDGWEYPDIQFFPEGGDLVAGIEGWVAFKAIDKYGKGVQVEGKIIDEKGKATTWYKTFHEGMGVFPFNPQKGKKYYAVCNHEGERVKKKYPLPRVLQQGYSLLVDNQSSEHIVVQVKSNLANGLDGAVVVGQLRGKIFCHIEAKGREINSRIEKTSLPSGIAQFTLFTKNGEPVCERLVFVKNEEKEINPEIFTDKKIYNRRSPVEITINTGGIKSDLSISITDSQLVKHDTLADNIKTNLLLTSDLKGNIENPGYYFLDDSHERRKHLDYVMMTHGWRRFSWKKIMRNELPTIKHLAEKGFNICGKITDLKKTPIKGSVSLTIVNEPLSAGKVTTGMDGKFWFLGYDLPYPTDIVLQAETAKTKKNGKNRKPSKHVNIKLDQTIYPNIGAYEISFLSEQRSVLPWKPYVEHIRKMQSIDSAFRLNESTIQLKGVTVKAPAIKANDPSGAIYATPSKRLVVDSLPAALAARDVIELIKGRVPGVQVFGNSGNYSILIRGQRSIQGSNEPLLLLDNMPVDMTTISSLSPNDVHYIDILKGAETAIFGARGANGVISVYTKRGQQGAEAPQPTTGILTLSHPGYHKAREFYSPNYKEKKPEHAKPDYRSTLYWNPLVSTTENGATPTKLWFYTSDKISTYRMEVEGITVDGRPIRSVSYFKTGL